ncbi:MAG: hypothetical protein ACLFM8_07010 [Halobacteriales archaeon]
MESPATWSVAGIIEIDIIGIGICTLRAEFQVPSMVWKSITGTLADSLEITRYTGPIADIVFVLATTASVAVLGVTVVGS